MKFHWEHIVGLLGLAVLVYGQYFGLFVVPPDSHMGDVARILFVHVPAAWNAFFVLTIGGVFALLYLLTGAKRFDHLLEGCLEVGTLLTFMLILQGSIFAKPTWGVWWTWDPRLVSSAVMLAIYVGVLVLRRTLNTDPTVRATLTSVAAVLASVTLPVNYFSVQIWRSMHQIQTAPTDIDSPLKMAWRINAIAFLLIAFWLVARRSRIAKDRFEAMEAPPLPPAPTVEAS